MDKRQGARLGVLLLLLLLVISGCTGTNQKQVSEPGTASEQSGQSDTVFRGIITANDTEQGTVVLQEPGSTVERTLTYNALSQITDKYGSEISGEELECGQIMEAEYSLSSAHISRMYVPEDVWEYSEVEKFKTDTVEKSLQVAGKKYQYSESTYIGAGDQRLELMELNRQDVLTVRGSGYTVYSIVRTQGHGYIRPTNYKPFIGGMIGVGNGIILPLTENMLITAREGTYRVLLNNGSLSAIKTVTVRDGEETVVDFSDYSSEAERVGSVSFEIEPAGADMTINGVQVDYSKPISLSYGAYRVGVTMNGYEDYTGTLNVQSSSSTIHISLVDKTAEVSDETTQEPDTSVSDDTDDSDTDSDTDADEDTDTRQIDSKHTITVNAPEGAEVYLDNVYKGLSPCTFTKIIGSQTITLRRDGYVTKSYSVDILDDSENVSLSFADLVKEEDSAGSAEPESSSDTN